MAPNHNGAIGYPFSDTNRCSPRIFNKNAMKFDVSMVNDKIGFMQAMNLVCVNNSKEFQSKLNWEVVTPGTILPLKECSVVLSNVSSNACGELFNNQTDLENQKNVYSKSCIDNCKTANIFQKQKFIKTSCAQSIDANILKNIEPIESEQSNTRKRKSNNGVTFKLTLKIGDEVISTKSCKKKYLNKENSNTQLSNTDFERCNDIKDSFCNSKLSSIATNSDQVCVAKSDTESLVQTESKQKRALAAALVQFELQRLCLQLNTIKNKEQNNDKATNVYKNNIDEEEEAATPKESERTALNAFIEGDVQEILRLNPKKIHNNGINTFQQNMLSSEKHYEIITIDDDVSDDSADDCIIINEYSSNDYSKDKENSYDFHVTNTNRLASHTIVEIKKKYRFDGNRIIKRQKLHNLDSEIFVTNTKTCPSLQSSLDRNYEKCRLNQFVCH